MHSAMERCLSVRPSVRLSIKRRHSVETAKHIFKLFSTQGSHTVLVFPYQMILQYSDGYLPNGGVECEVHEKSRFSTNISLYLGNDTTQSIVTMEGE